MEPSLNTKVKTINEDEETMILILIMNNVFIRNK